MKVTVKDIANVCGVSTGTVDRAIHNRAGISEKTKNRILKVAKELNYKPDYSARSLAMGKTKTIGIVLFDLHNRSFAELLTTIEIRARELGYFVCVTFSDKNKKDEMACIDFLVNRKVDGIILLTVNKGKQFESFLSKLNIPIVTIFNLVSDKWEFIGVRERQAMRNAIDYVVAQKRYNKFIYISPPLSNLGEKNIYTQEERYNGFLESLKRNKIDTDPIIIKDFEYIKELDRIQIHKLGNVAVICSTDHYALEVINYLKEKEIVIPEQVGVMGFDDIDMLKYITPRLTTVKYPIDEIGKKVIESIINKVEHGEFISTPLLDYEIVKGDSI